MMFILELWVFCTIAVGGFWLIAAIITGLLTPGSWKDACAKQKKEMDERMQGPYAHGMDRPEDNHLY